MPTTEPETNPYVLAANGKTPMPADGPASITTDSGGTLEVHGFGTIKEG